MSANDLPEYHELFRGMGGDVTLKVRFAHRQEIKGRCFPAKQIHWQDLRLLFGCQNGVPYERMSFDEWPFGVKKIEIEPGKRRVTLVIE